ncbi:MAG: AEC family transporter [Cyanobacteria bacterium P01_F01_bin.153]
MNISLTHVYTPLILWTLLGVVLQRWLPTWVPRLLGRSLYWVGIPLVIFSSARGTELSAAMGIAPTATLIALLSGLGFGLLALKRAQQSPPLQGKNLRVTGVPMTRSPVEGSLLLTSMLGNAGFVGLAIVPSLLEPEFKGLPAFYAVTQSAFGTYGIGALVGNYYSDRPSKHPWWGQLKKLATVPALWSLAIGILTQPVDLPFFVPQTISYVKPIISPCAFVLMGIRLAGLTRWQHIKLALLPTAIKMLAVPLLVFSLLSLFPVSNQARLGMVLMAGMPSAFSCLILAEEYNLDRAVASGAIALSTACLLVMLPFWVGLLG